MAAITCEVKWLKALLLNMGVNHPKDIPLFCDSQSALNIANNPVFYESTKVDCHSVRDVISDLAPSHVTTFEQLVDIFTKALGKRQFEMLCCPSGHLYDLPHWGRGRDSDKIRNSKHILFKISFSSTRSIL